jgi:Ca-activated chloride channel family protein
MTSRILLISLSVLLLAWQKTGAQLAPAQDFFNGGAQLYISNNIPAALSRVQTGLQLYPDDEKLKKLEQLLKQQQQQQQQKNQQQQNQQSQQNSQQQQKQDQQKQEEQKKQEQQKQQQQQQQSSAQKKEGDKQEEAQPVQAGQMTPEEAKRLLDAQKDNEQLLRMKPEEKPRDMSHPVRDW